MAAVGFDAHRLGGVHVVGRRFVCGYFAANFLFNDALLTVVSLTRLIMSNFGWSTDIVLIPSLFSWRLVVWCLSKTLVLGTQRVESADDQRNQGDDLRRGVIRQLTSWPAIAAGPRVD